MRTGSPLVTLRRLLPRAFAAATLTAVTAAAVAGADLAIRSYSAWEQEARRNEREIGLDVILCLRGTCGRDATISDLERVSGQLSQMPGATVSQVGATDLRAALAGLLPESDLAAVRLPLTLRVAADLPELERAVDRLVGDDPAVARIQPRNLAARELAGRGRDAAAIIAGVALLQGVSAAAALTGLIRARVLQHLDDIRLMNLSGVHPRRIRRPHIAAAAAVGAVGGAAGSILAGLISAGGPFARVLPVLAEGGPSWPAWVAAASLASAAVAAVAARHDVRDIPL